jgi:micrococcal nuclease
MRPRWSFLALCAIVAGGILLQGWLGPIENATARRGPYPVLRVVDGDTIHVDANGTDTTVRLIGVDTPERGDCYEDEATAELRDLLADRQVWLEADPTQGDEDRYQRKLRFVFIDQQGAMANLTLVRGGFGTEYLFDRPYHYRDHFVRAEAQARQERAGLWAACNAA